MHDKNKTESKAEFGEIKQQEPIVVVSRAVAVQRAEIDSQIATAKQYPRDIHTFKDRLMSLATLDQETAEGCYYALPRGGKTIDGPSVRLAELALSCYGNCVAEALVTDEDGEFVYATGSCRDLENNIAVRVTVRRRITDRNGSRFNADMIAVTANAACSIALRNAIFKAVPAAYVKPIFDRVKETAVGKAESLTNRRAEVLNRLQKLGVTEVRALAAVNRASVDDVTRNDVVKLIGLGTAVKEGEYTLDDAFPLPSEPPKAGFGDDVRRPDDDPNPPVKLGDALPLADDLPQPEQDEETKAKVDAQKEAMNKPAPGTKTQTNIF